MARRTNQPALYELIRDPSMLTPGGTSGAAAPGDVPGTPEPDAAERSTPASHPTPPQVARPATPPSPRSVSPGQTLVSTRAPASVSGESDPRRAAAAPSVAAARTASGASANSGVAGPASPGHDGGVSAAGLHATGPGRPAAGEAPGSAARGVLGIHASSRVLRVPMGWVWIAAATVVIALFVSFTLGHRSGAAQAERDRAAGLGLSDAHSPVGDGFADPAGAGDPLVRPSGAADAQRAAGAVDPRQGSAGRAPAGREVAGAPNAAAGDPRVRGHSYFVVAHPLPERADELVAFLRSEGLDGAVIRERGSRFPKVIALPGFEDPKSPAASAFRSKLRTAGLRWKAKTRGNQDFGNAYLERYGS